MQYFISYTYPKGHGNMVMTCEGVINSIDNIREIQRYIKAKENIGDVIILNFINISD